MTSNMRRAGHRRGGPWWPTALVVVAGVVGLGGCSSGSPDRPAGRIRPAPAPVVLITMRDHSFELDTDVPAGRVVFRVANAGQVPHQLTMIRLPPDVPPIAEQLRGTERRLVEPYAGIYERKPGDTGTFAVDLRSGQRYALICSVRAKDGQPHWMKGMVSEFRTPGSPPADVSTTTSTTSTPPSVP